ncbi:hypothetical protein [Nocardia miyunensis]|uniref:hypothetical protein n=1 Tax=Nocardia miyunensis TaxID=282684 RepID=UPI0008378329|nr:hypothetical protein [Nocardia miyunensis]
MRVGPSFDRERYEKAANLAAAAALFTRASSLPAPWVFDEPALRRPMTAGTRDATAYRLFKRLGVASAAWDCVRTRRVSARSIVLTLVAEWLTASRLEGFAPYTEHLYLFALCLRASKTAGPGERADGVGRVPVLAYLAPTIYLASAIAKLRHGGQSWLRTGDVIDNALSLYRWNRVSEWAALVDPVVLARLVLAFELVALPISVSGPTGLRVVSVSGLLLHVANYATLRVSFWHLAFTHLPTLYAIRRTVRGK